MPALFFLGQQKKLSMRTLKYELSCCLLDIGLSKPFYTSFVLIGESFFAAAAFSMETLA
jgi:hypothetical protein